MNLRYNFKYNNLTTINNGGIHTLKYQSSRPNALTDHKFENGNVTIPNNTIDKHEYVYTAFDKLASIDQEGIATLEMKYGVDQQRIHMQVAEYGNITIDNYYISSANMEINNGNEHTYLYAEGQADSYRPFAIYKSNTDELFYLHLDNQGSLMAISNNTGFNDGTVIEYRSYDAWGRSRDPNTWEYNTNVIFGGAGYGITTRGYTMHEHLEMFSLINMNGRLYDPILGRMLSPDNYIQAPENTQSYNRYSYCVNNPLKYTDPTGNLTMDDVGAGLAIIGGVALLATGNPYGAVLIAGGGSHFISTLNGVVNHNQSWDNASNYSGLTLSGTINANLTTGSSNSAQYQQHKIAEINYSVGENKFVDMHNSINFMRPKFGLSRPFISSFDLGVNGRVDIFFMNKLYGGVQLGLGYIKPFPEGNYNWFQTICSNKDNDLNGKAIYADYCKIDAGTHPPYYNTETTQNLDTDYLTTFYDAPERDNPTDKYTYWRAELSLVNTDTHERLITLSYGFYILSPYYGGGVHLEPIRSVFPSAFHLKSFPK